MKPIAESKTRLGDAVSVGRRAVLSVGMLARVLSAARMADEIEDTVVYGGDDAVRHACERIGADWRADPGAGLNGCLETAFTAAAADGVQRGLFLPADLPLVTGMELSSFISAAGDAPVALGPDRRDDGTNALLVGLETGFSARLGPASFGRHLDEAAKLGIRAAVFRSELIGLDIDTPSDIDRLVAVSPGIWDDLQREVTDLGLESLLTSVGHLD